MRKNKILGVALAAAILASGGSVAGSVFTAVPAEAATVAATTSAVGGLKAFTDVATLQDGVLFTRPTRIVGTITSYTVTLKQAGKADRVFINKSGRQMFGAAGAGLAENTAYTVQVKANVVSRTGAKSFGAVASTTFKTGWARTTVKATAPVGIRATDVGENSFVARWTAPVAYVGSVTGYTVKVKQGTVIMKTVTVSASTYSYKADALAASSGYTVDVTANFVSANGVNKATSAASSVTAFTAKPLAVGLKPVVTISNITSNTATASWTPTSAPNPAVYMVFVTEKGGNSTLNLGRWPIDRNSIILDPALDLKPNTTYIVTVQVFLTAYDSAGNSAYAGTTEFTTKAL